MIPSSRLPAELGRVRNGALVQMPREEFEALVERATRQKNAPARLVSAKYTAELVGNALKGTGRWSVSAAAPGVLPLAQFNLALDSWRWPADAQAILGNLDQNGLGLLVRQGGAFSFEW